MFSESSRAGASELLILSLSDVFSLPPKPTHYVTDRAGVVTNAKALDDKLAQFERDTSDQILVYVEIGRASCRKVENLGGGGLFKKKNTKNENDKGSIVCWHIRDHKQMT